MAIFLPECGWTEVITLKIKPKIMTHNSSKEIITFFLYLTAFHEKKRVDDLLLLFVYFETRILNFGKVDRV